MMNIINSLTDFYEDIETILLHKKAFFYVVENASSNKTIKQIEKQQDFEQINFNHYQAFFITSEPYQESVDFYDEEFASNVIEGGGGRINETELENITLRLVAKKHQAPIKSIYNAITKKLKSNPTYGIGIEPFVNSFYKNTLYKKSMINNKTLWFDFERKSNAIKIRI